MKRNGGRVHPLFTAFPFHLWCSPALSFPSLQRRGDQGRRDDHKKSTHPSKPWRSQEGTAWRVLQFLFPLSFLFLRHVLPSVSWSGLGYATPLPNVDTKEWTKKREGKGGRLFSSLKDKRGRDPMACTLTRSMLSLSDAKEGITSLRDGACRTDKRLDYQETVR